jgi:acetyl-CoA carboxylase carboxyl transferase subunit beta
LEAANPLEFVDSKPYSDRIKATQKSTGLKDSMRTATGKVDGVPMTVCCMDFNFIGGSMGAVVGEKIARAVDHCIANRQALMIISKSGGARMMEAAFSLMQMAKTSAKLALLNKAGVPYISLMTNPTTGGVTASFAMLGDFNIAEPEALIGFAGPRVIKETIGRDLPKGFQSSEFLVEHGFLDFIVKRTELKEKLTTLLSNIWRKNEKN